MSGHIIYVWDAKHGLPQSFQDAVTIFQKIENLNEQPSLPMLRFAERMQNIVRLRLETSEELNNNREFQEWFYDIKQEMREHKQAVFTIHIPVENDLEIMKLVTKAATGAQLVAFDDRYAMVFLPSGQIWPIERARIFEDVLEIKEQEQELPKDEMEFAAWIEPYINDIVLKEGFILTGPPKKLVDGTRVLIEHVYQQKIQGGHQTLTFCYTRYRKSSRMPYDGGYNVFATINIFLPQVIDIYRIYGFRLSMLDWPTFTIGSSTFIKNELVPKTHKSDQHSGFMQLYSKKEVLERLFIYRQAVLPFANITTTMVGVDTAVNQGLSEWYDFNFRRHEAELDAPKCLILAKLVNNPHFEQLVEQLANPKTLTHMDSDVQKEYQIAYAKLVKYLFEEES